MESKLNSSVSDKRDDVINPTRMLRHSNCVDDSVRAKLGLQEDTKKQEKRKRTRSESVRAVIIERQRQTENGRIREDNEIEAVL